MKIRRLRLVNFRQHADTDLEFGDGITGVIGPNGSGKTTLLEAIAWALYGHPAARGDKDSIRNLRAKPRSSVRVELELELGRHACRVVRGLHHAELYRDGVLVANSLTEVTALLERALGMTYNEFFSTYFTGQKELAVMASLGKAEREKFLSRVLGYERLELAQVRVRERRLALANELKGLEAGLPDRQRLATEREEAVARLTRARGAARAVEDARAAAQAALAREEPRWQEWVARRERIFSLDGERRMAEQAVQGARQEFQRLDKELAEALQAQEELHRLAPELEPIARLKVELAGLERLQREEMTRQTEAAQLVELARALAALEGRLAALAASAETLALVEQEVAALDQQLRAAARAAEEERAGWVREREYAQTRRVELLKQYEDVKGERDGILALGPEGTCPTCRRPLGTHYEEVLAVLDRQLEAITNDGKYFRQRLDELAAMPAKVQAADAAREVLREERARVGERAGALRAQVEERARLEDERARSRERAREIERQLYARPTGYDAGRHDAVRAELARLEPVALEAAGLRARADRAEALVREAELAERALELHERRARQLVEAVRAEGYSEGRFKVARERHERALGALRAADLTVVETRGDLTRAEEDVRAADRRESERAAREQEIGALKERLRLHGELDKAFGELRAELNAAMRPEIAELGSTFLADLTDGRYGELDLNESYELMILDDGIPKPVISGGEEDVANLALRLAISQMIAERAGQPLSLLVLDEIFGSLDDTRRQHVLRLLRGLGDRFPQVIVITHIEQVRERLDRVIRVEYDAGRGTSVARDETATLPGGGAEGGGGTDAGVAA